MKRETRKIIILLVLSVLLVFSSVYLLCIDDWLNQNSVFLDSYAQYCPSQCPNSLWISTDGDVYFAVDSNKQALGAERADGGTKYFCPHFSYHDRVGRFSFQELDDMAFPEYGDPYRSYIGECSYSKDRLTITFDEAGDEDLYMGRGDGEEQLTFVRTELTAPFSFDDEESLNELPFR